MGTLRPHYLDASIIVALLTAEWSSERADHFIRANPVGLIVSDFAAAEFASAIARRVRMREVTRIEAQADLSALNRWVSTSVRSIEVCAADIALVTMLLRRLDLTLRTPDAIHIALAQRLDAILATLDREMAGPPARSAWRSRCPRDCRRRAD